MTKEALLLLFLVQYSVLLAEGAPAPALQQTVNGWRSLQLSAIKSKQAVGDIWTNCGQPGDHGRISDVSIIPDPPVIGENVTIAASIQTDETVTGGEVKIHIVLGFLPYNKNYDLCHLTGKVGHPCPIPPGLFHANVTTKIPTFVPKDNYKGRVIVTDQNQKHLACVDLKLSL